MIQDVCFWGIIFLFSGKKCGIVSEKKGLANMQRTPQPNLTQTKLTGFGVTRGPSALPAQAQAAPASETRAVDVAEGSNIPTTESSSMDTTPAPQTEGGGGQVITTDFILRSLQENTNQIIKSFTAHLGALSQRVDVNSPKIAGNSENIKKKMEITSHGKEIEHLASRIRDLEESAGTMMVDPHRRADLSGDYLWARRSLWLWPIPGRSDEEMWAAVGDFIHETLCGARRQPTANVGPTRRKEAEMDCPRKRTPVEKAGIGPGSGQFRMQDRTS